jgi:hypothetical protein
MTVLSFLVGVVMGFLWAGWGARRILRPSLRDAQSQRGSEPRKHYRVLWSDRFNQPI